MSAKLSSFPRKHPIPPAEGLCETRIEVHCKRKHHSGSNASLALTISALMLSSFKVRQPLQALLTFGLLTLAGCGGGGGGNEGSNGPSTNPPSTSNPAVPTPQLPATGSAIALTSAIDNPIGRGTGYSYTQSTAQIEVTQSNNYIKIQVLGDERWTAELILGNDVSALKPGDYPGLGTPFGPDAVAGAFQWQAMTPIVGCSAVKTQLKIDRLAFEGGKLSELSLSFEQSCPSGGPLKGAVRWTAADTSRGPGPVQPIPATLWAPSAGATPVSGNYVYIESSSGDTVGLGKTHLHTLADTLIRPILAGPRMQFVVQGDVTWYGDLMAMDSLSRVQSGYYADLRDYGARNPRKGGLRWHTGTRSCESKSRGWIAVDAVRYEGDVMTSIDLRFEQRCQDGTAAPLRGKIHWTIDDTTLPTGPTRTIPANLWHAPGQMTPANGNFVYLEGDGGEWVSSGQTLLYTPSNAAISVFQKADTLNILIGDQEWTGLFSADYSRPQLSSGFYAGLLTVPFHNPAKGGVRWSGQGRSCSGINWLAIDDVAYTYGELRHVDLRFEQVCEGSDKRLHGRVRWASADPVVLENRIDPPARPATPPSYTPPAGGNYVLLDSGSDDYIGGGRTYLYTSANAQLKATANGGALTFEVKGDEYWDAKFLNRAQPDALPGPGTYPMDVETGMPRLSEWWGDGRNCNGLRGSFTIERLERNANGIQALDMSFEQYCDDNFTPLRGRIHWASGDTTQPPGPIVPAPTDLWRLPASMTPSNGSYLFVHSAPGGFIGNGSNHLFTPESHDFRVAPVGNGISVNIGINQWMLDLQPMRSISRLQPGYYGNLRSVSGSINPTRGGLSFSGDHRGCNTSSGWFVVDAVTYDADGISALDARFLQLCEQVGPPLYGQLHWRR